MIWDLSYDKNGDLLDTVVDALHVKKPAADSIGFFESLGNEVL